MQIKGLRRRVARRFAALPRQLYRLDRPKVVDALRSLGKIRTDTLFVHSSLSACGLVKGGPFTIVSGLQEWLGPDKNLVMPTHSYCYPDRDNNVEIFDPRSTTSRVGAITDYFWREPGVARSLHPSHSLAVLGPANVRLCVGHEYCDTPCGRGTPYERLIQRDAAVLMFGATMNAYTLFHTAEDAGRAPYLYMVVPVDLRARRADGSIIQIRMRRQDMSVPRKFEEMASWLEERGVLVRRRLGMGELLFIPSSARVHRLIQEEIRKDPYFLVSREFTRAINTEYEKQAS
jgi:aminoglycoside 3-N-acetyltransferase